MASEFLRQQFQAIVERKDRRIKQQMDEISTLKRHLSSTKEVIYFNTNHTNQHPSKSHTNSPLPLPTIAPLSPSRISLLGDNEVSMKQQLEDIDQFSDTISSLVRHLEAKLNENELQICRLHNTIGSQRLKMERQQDEMDAMRRHCTQYHARCIALVNATKIMKEVSESEEKVVVLQEDQKVTLTTLIDAVKSEVCDVEQQNVVSSIHTTLAHHHNALKVMDQKYRRYDIENLSYMRSNLLSKVRSVDPKQRKHFQAIQKRAELTNELKSKFNSSDWPSTLIERQTTVSGPVVSVNSTPPSPPSPLPPLSLSDHDVISMKIQSTDCNPLRKQPMVRNSKSPSIKLMSDSKGNVMETSVNSASDALNVIADDNNDDNGDHGNDINHIAESFNDKEVMNPLKACDAVSTGNAPMTTHSNMENDEKVTLSSISKTSPTAESIVSRIRKTLEDSFAKENASQSNVVNVTHPRSRDVVDIQDDDKLENLKDIKGCDVCNEAEEEEEEEKEKEDSSKRNQETISSGLEDTESVFDHGDSSQIMEDHPVLQAPMGCLEDEEEESVHDETTDVAMEWRPPSLDLSEEMRRVCSSPHDAVQHTLEWKGRGKEEHWDSSQEREASKSESVKSHVNCAEKKDSPKSEDSIRSFSAFMRKILAEVRRSTIDGQP